MANIEKSRVAEANKLFEKIENRIKCSYVESLPDAMRIGEILTEVKMDLPHGQFQPYVQANFVGSLRTARRWMNLHKNRHEIKTASVATLNDAIKLLEGSKVKILSGIFTEPTTFMNIKDIEPNPFYKMSKLIGEEVEYWINVIRHRKELGYNPNPYWGTVVRFTGKEYQNVCEHERFFAMKSLKIKELWVCVLEGKRMLSDESMKEVLETFDYPRFYKYEKYQKELWKDESEVKK